MKTVSAVLLVSLMVGAAQVQDAVFDRDLERGRASLG